MKQHKRIVISLALALILLVGALPALVQNNSTSISNFQYDGTDGSTSEYKLSWDTIANSSIYRFQLKGACVSQVWVSTNVNSTRSSGGKSYLRTGVVRNYGCSTTLRFRLKLQIPGGYTSWAYASL